MLHEELHNEKLTAQERSIPPAWGIGKSRNKFQINFESCADIRVQLDRLPPIIARAEVHKLLGGVISPKSLANADSLGLGPAGRIKIGRRVAYDTKALLAWLETKSN